MVFRDMHLPFVYTLIKPIEWSHIAPDKCSFNKYEIPFPPDDCKQLSHLLVTLLPRVGARTLSLLGIRRQLGHLLLLPKPSITGLAAQQPNKVVRNKKSL
jgi:hypothetical protein